MRAISIVGSAACALALTSFAIPFSKPAAQPTVLHYHGMPLNRAFRIPLTLTGTGTGGGPTALQLPAGGGIVITQVGQFGQSPDLHVAVNGVSERFTANNSAFTHTHDLNPPIIARPGDTLTITPGVFNETIVVSGYTTLPGET